MWNWGTEKPNADYISRSDAFVLSNIRYARRSRNGTFGLEAQIVRIHKGPPRAGLRPSGKPELFHSNHSGHTGSIFLNGRSRARVAHWGHQKTKQNNKRKRQDIEKRRDERESEWESERIDRKRSHINECLSTWYSVLPFPPCNHGDRPMSHDQKLQCYVGISAKDPQKISPESSEANLRSRTRTSLLSGQACVVMLQILHCSVNGNNAVK